MYEMLLSIKACTLGKHWWSTLSLLRTARRSEVTCVCKAKRECCRCGSERCVCRRRASAPPTRANSATSGLSSVSPSACVLEPASFCCARLASSYSHCFQYIWLCRCTDLAVLTNSNRVAIAYTSKEIGILFSLVIHVHVRIVNPQSSYPFLEEQFLLSFSSFSNRIILNSPIWTFFSNYDQD